MLAVQDLTVRYGARLALDAVSFTVEPGRLMGIIGPNGAGKSTLIRAIMGLTPIDRGQVMLLGTPVFQIRERVAYVPQRSGIDWDFPALVKEVVMMGVTPYLGWLGRYKTEHYQRVEQALERVSMGEFAERRIGELSGGQQQRVFIARSLVQEAQLYLFDEPFVGVDSVTEQAILRLFEQLRDAGKSVLIVNHDLGRVIERYDDILMLRGKVIAWGARSRIWTQENLNRTYLGPVALV